MLKKSASLSSAQGARLARQARLASPDFDCLAFLASLACLARLSCAGVLPLSLTSGPLNFHRATIVYSQTPSLGVRADICLAVSVQYFRTSERWRFSCG
jgi:hypothetical protein